MQPYRRTEIGEQAYETGLHRMSSEEEVRRVIRAIEKEFHKRLYDAKRLAGRCTQWGCYARVRGTRVRCARHLSEHTEWIKGYKKRKGK